LQINTYPGVKEYDKSGSCCIISLIINEKLYVANVGDSRCLLKEKKELVSMSTDHKPSEEEERKRVVENGGQIYQSQGYE